LLLRICIDVNVRFISKRLLPSHLACSADNRAGLLLCATEGWWWWNRSRLPLHAVAEGMIVVLHIPKGAVLRNHRFLLALSESAANTSAARKLEKPT